VKVVRCSTRFLLYPLMALVMMICIADPAAFAKDKESKLPPQYREWLDRDAAYIITRGEKAQFLSLTSDAERDKFIAWFWAVRNPNPDSPVNIYREEHYKRLAYADDHFGIGKRMPGWATERGRMYIVLGPPKQMANYQGYDRVRPMQIWFYESPSPGLPPYFYILFYKKDSVGDYVTYSPYFNGPQDLVTERGVTITNAVQMIHRDLGQEVVRTSLSLLPDEPVDTQNPRPSMQSDVLMSQLHDLANSTYNVAALQHRAAMMNVTSRLLVGGGTLGVLTAPLRDSDGNVKLHYLLRLKRPEDFAVGKSADGNYYISLEASVQVLTSDDKPIFTQERRLKKAMTQEQVNQVKNKVFGYEDWLPLPAGQYHLKFSLGNPINSIAYQAEANVVVPDVPASGLLLTPLIPFTSAEALQPQLSGLVPFSVSGLRFSPLLPREMNYSPATDLQFFYQVWASHDHISKKAAMALEARYAFGRPGAVGEAKVITEQVAGNQMDSTGTLLTGKKIPLGDWAQGNYLLTLSVDTPDGEQKASATLSFRLLLSTPVDPDWDVFDGDSISRDVRTGISDYERGMCYLAFDRKQEAARSFRESLYKNSNEDARSALVNVEFGQNNFSEVARIARDFPITADTQDETILRLADALDKTGDTKEAINFLQSALKLKAPSSPVYLTLASYYRTIGDEKNSDDFQKKGQALARGPSPR
jgi:GWxTD domain-containing protein